MLIAHGTNKILKGSSHREYAGTIFTDYTPGSEWRSTGQIITGTPIDQIHVEWNVSPRVQKDLIVTRDSIVLTLRKDIHSTVVSYNCNDDAFCCRDHDIDFHSLDGNFAKNLRKLLDIEPCTVDFTTCTEEEYFQHSTVLDCIDTYKELQLEVKEIYKIVYQ